MAIVQHINLFGDLFNVSLFLDLVELLLDFVLFLLLLIALLGSVLDNAKQRLY